MEVDLNSREIPLIVQNYINGRWVKSASGRFLDITNPATGEVISKTSLSNKDDFDKAVKAAKEAFPKWRRTPPIVRSRYFFKLRQLLEEIFEDLSRLLTIENGKTLIEARGSVRRAIENVEVACGIPTVMQGYNLEDVAPGIDCTAIRQPLGVFGCITPFNFPAMVPLWFFPTAVACGNTFVVKTSEQTPLCQARIFELLEEAGFPPGVINLVNGDAEVAKAMLEHPDIKGVSFVGSSKVAQQIYRRASENGKRVQALGGAKNFTVVMPDAMMDKTVSVLIDSAFGNAGERCLATAIVLTVGSAYDMIRDALVDTAKKMKIGNGLDDSVTLGPVISAAHRERVIGYINKGIQEGAKILLDGRKAVVPEYPNGYYVGPTVFDDVTANMTIAKEEIFGPVLGIMRVNDLDEALSIIHNCQYGNTCSIFTQSGPAARKFRYEAGISMLGINIGVAAPMAFFTFGGAKNSFYGDLKAYGRDGVEFYTDKRIVIERWF
ncbi:MAG: methylmalonate-semialdehyde dehydrogenase (CoA acylating) [candidate division Zixibacteria bacterium CG_4_9_14_3_um_filter_46_8]|nr:MAG: methylmalonate-semialdehyde dehydrogenase (CoA acylating) [candidate division Zixibacteria bacterium CG_4_9_14_3_um_filter_46_8]